MTHKKKVLIIVSIVIIILIILGAFFIIFNLRNTAGNLAPISFPISSSTNINSKLDIDFERIETIVKSLSWNLKPEPNLPISYEFPTLPDIYVNQIMKFLPTQTDYVSKTSITSETGVWDVYDYSYGKFKEIYYPYYYSQGSVVTIFAFNSTTQKFITIPNDNEFAHDLPFIKGVIKFFESSDYYKNPSYQNLEILRTKKLNSDYDMQFDFNSISNFIFLKSVFSGTASIENNEWKMQIIPYN